MPSLHELQSDVMRALLDEEPERAAALISARRIAPEQALGVYANNVRVNFIDSLKSSFPAVLRLVGEDYFFQAARGFHRRHPSASGDLQPAGSQFAQYLSQLHGADPYRYLGEVARLEWLIQESLLAADHGPLDLRKLGQAAPETYDDLRFCLHPSARLFASEFPCLAIWEANVGSEAEPEPIDLDRGADRVLLVRDGGQLKFHRLSRGEEAFLLALRLGERFAAAVASGCGHEIDGGSGHEIDAPGVLDSAAGFDPAAALRRFVLAAVIVDFQ
jgi:hypothetical protein